jgi:hypothetical protein
MHKQFPGAMDAVPSGMDDFMSSFSKIGFLWLIPIGAIGVVLLSLIFNLLSSKGKSSVNVTA